MNHILNNQVSTVAGIINNLKPVTNVQFNNFDTMTVQSVSYHGLVANDTVFLVKCLFNNAYVASFTVDDNLRATVTPLTVLKLNNVTDVSFEIHYIDANGGVVPLTGEASFVSIILNFIKYKN